MASVNKVLLIGRLGQDLELRHTQGGTAVVTLSVATDERVKKGDEWTSVTTWHRVTAWGKQAENAAKYLAKGSQVYVEGTIRNNKFTDKNGIERQNNDITALTIQYLSHNKDGAGQRQSSSDNVDTEEYPALDEINF